MGELIFYDLQNCNLTTLSKILEQYFFLKSDIGICGRQSDFFWNILITFDQAMNTTMKKVQKSKQEEKSKHVK